MGKTGSEFINRTLSNRFLLLRSVTGQWYRRILPAWISWIRLERKQGLARLLDWRIGLACCELLFFICLSCVWGQRRHLHLLIVRTHLAPQSVLHSLTHSSVVGAGYLWLFSFQLWHDIGTWILNLGHCTNPLFRNRIERAHGAVKALFLLSFSGRKALGEGMRLGLCLTDTF